MPATQQARTTSPIGRKTPRVDGPLKVTGKAQYGSDFHFPGMLYAVPVEATIANGRVEKIDTATAEKMPGARAIFHRENIGKIIRSVQGPGFEGIIDERRPPFEDDIVRYYGQYIALAVADTFESAKAAADAVRGIYRFFAMVMTPAALLSKASQMWSALYNRGQLQVADQTDHGATIKLLDFPSETAGCSRTTGWIERMAELTGVRDVRIQQTQCYARGAPHCEWSITWS